MADIYHTLGLYGLAIVAGVVAGLINTLAGSGSLITLPMLMSMGLPAGEANGTNRIGVICQNITAVIKYRQQGKLDLSDSQLKFVSVTIGAFVGSLVAIDLSDEQMRMIIGIVLCIMLVVILCNPKAWLRDHTDVSVKWSAPARAVLFFFVGIYGGFIQAGIGVLLLVSLVAASGYPIVKANGLKLALVLVFSIPALIVFVAYGQVNWGLGLVVAVGQVMGAYIAANYATKSTYAALWMHRLLILIIVISIAKWLYSI